jgi:prolipoprotein diacylglyceryl transferase
VNLAALPPPAVIPSPTQGIWHLGPIPIRAYAICIVLGIIVACVITEIRMRRRGAPAYAVLDIAVWAVPAGIIGARIYHVLTSPDEYFGADGDPLEALKIWRGGLGIWGAVLGGALGAWLACRRLGIPLTFVADALAPGLPVAQAIGRWGNWFNNELYGKETSLPWGLRIYDWDPDTGKAQMLGDQASVKGIFQPTFLYESLWDVGVALLVWLLDRRYRFGLGRAFALYVMAYTVGRFWIEALRSDPAHEFIGLRVNGWVSIVVFLGALIYFLRVRGPQEQLAVDEDGTVRVLPAAGAEAPVEASAEAAAEAPADADAEAEGVDTAAPPPETEPAAPSLDAESPTDPAATEPPAESADTVTPATDDDEAGAAARSEESEKSAAPNS